MNLERTLQTAPLRPLDLARVSKATLDTLDLSHQAAVEFEPLDMHRGDAEAMAPKQSFAELVAPKHDGSLDARRQAEIFVSQAFFGTMLRQMRESPFKSDLFEGGRGGQAFGSLYDQHLAERMASGAGKSLVNSIVRHLEGRKAYERTLAGSRLNRATTRSAHATVG